MNLEKEAIAKINSLLESAMEIVYENNFNGALFRTLEACLVEVEATKEQMRR